MTVLDECRQRRTYGKSERIDVGLTVGRDVTGYCRGLREAVTSTSRMSCQVR